MAITCAPERSGVIRVRADGVRAGGVAIMKAAVVTGCDSGIGMHLREELLRNGYAVLASYLSGVPVTDKENLYGCGLDLRDEASVDEFARFVGLHLDRGLTLDFLVNNAGVGIGGPAENVPMRVLREVFEVNFFGTVALTQRLIPRLIESRARIVMIGSLAGRVALPFMAPYAASKFALEGYCDSLRRELAPFGIRTILIEPAAIATPIWNKAMSSDISFVADKYRKSLARYRDVFLEDGNRGMDAARAARMIYRVITRRKPPVRRIVAGNGFVAALKARIPDRLLDRIVVKMFSMDYGA